MKRLLFATALAVACGSTALADFTPGTLAAYWPLDETNASETTVLDASGNSNDGARRYGPIVAFPAINGPVLNTNGPTINATMRNAAEFDGSNDILFVAHDASLDSAAAQGAISFWVNTDVDARQAVLHQQDPGDGTLTGFALEKSGSGVSYAIFFTPNVDNGTYFMSAHDPTPNTWEHYVFTWDVTATNSGDNADPNRIKCFVNGSPVLNNTAGGGGTVDTGFTVAPTLGNLVFGRRFYDAVNSRPFDGEMAEIAIFDATVDATKAMDLFNTGVNPADPDLVAYYDFSEGSGTSIADDSANSNDMITSEPTTEFPISDANGPQWAAAQANGKPAYFDRALQFDGTNDAVTFPDSASLDWDKDAGTVVMWLYGASATTRYGLLGSSGGGFQSETHSSTRNYFYPDGFNLYLPATGSRVANQWYHIAFVWDASEPVASDRWAMYYNGAFVANTQPHTFAVSATTNDWTMGRKAELSDTANPRWFDGQMADVAMFSEALSAADILEIYNNGVAAFTTIPEPPILDGIVISDSDSPTPGFGNGAGVQVAITASGGVADTVELAEDMSFTSSTLQAYAATVPFALEPGTDGIRTIWARLENGDGTSNVTSGTITLDTQPPMYGPGTPLEYNGTPPATMLPVQFTVGFSEMVLNLTEAGIDLSNSTAPGTLSAAVGVVSRADGTEFTIDVSGAADSGLIQVDLLNGFITDQAGNPFDATGASASVTYTAPANITDWKSLDR